MNPPLAHWEPDRPVLRSVHQRRDDLFVVLAFSGGGTRAALFGYGVLEELRDTWIKIGDQPRRLLDEVDLVSGVSGGSFTAAYHGLHGEGIFEEFEARFLERNVQRDLLRADLGPIPIARAVAASSAVPGPLTLIVLRSHVYLLGGGIADNLGVRFSFERTVEEGGIHELLDRTGIARTRQILMIVVNAETEPQISERQGGLFTTGIAGMIRIVSGIQIRSSNFETVELVRNSFEGWASELSKTRGEPVHFGLVDLYFEAHSDPEERAFLRNLPTNFALREEDVTRLRAAGRELLRSSPLLRRALDQLAALPD